MINNTHFFHIRTSTFQEKLYYDFFGISLDKENISELNKVLLFTAIGELVTADEASLLFNMSFKERGFFSSTLYSAKTRGYLVSYPLPVYDGINKSVYGLSSKGAAIVSDIGPGYFLKVSDGKQPSHEYATGFTFFQLLLGLDSEGGKLLRSDKEVVRGYTAGDVNGYRTVRIDLEMQVRCSSRNAPSDGNLYYIEQDMGTETVARLADKLNTYSVIDDFKKGEYRNSVVVMSFHKRIGRVTFRNINKGKIHALIQYGESNGCKDIGSLSEVYFKAKANKELDRGLSTDLGASWMDILSYTFKENTSLDVVKKCVNEGRRDQVLLDGWRCVSEYQFSRNRTKELMRYYADKYVTAAKAGDLITASVGSLALGLSCYGIPTMSASSFAPLLFSTDLYDRIGDKVEEYSGFDININGSDVLRRFGPFALRNYRRGTGLNVAIEDAAYDIGGFLRVVAFLTRKDMAMSELGDSLCLVILIEPDTINELSRYISIPSIAGDRVIADEGLTVCFVSHRDPELRLKGLLDGTIVEIEKYEE